MIQLPVLDYHCHGQVTPDELNYIRGILEECYPGLGLRPPAKVEVRLFETANDSLEFLSREKKELGISTSGDEAFICTHDAWRGYSRLAICLERLNALSPLIRQGVLRHEAAHSVLHGGPEYYVMRIPADCVDLARNRGIDSKLLQQVFYYCAIAVKDLEVTRLLLSGGYVECQAAFIESGFLLSEDDKLAWNLLNTNSLGKLFFFCSQLKTLLVGIPLEVEGLVELETWTVSMLSYVDFNERRNWLRLAGNLAGQMGDNTHDNINLALRTVLQMSDST